MLGRRWLLFFMAVGVSGGGNSDGMKPKKGKKDRDKTPPQRLDRLVKFSKEWLSLNIRDAEGSKASKKFRNNFYNRVLGHIEKRADRMIKVYNAGWEEHGKRRCGYYDPQTTYGGPQVVPPEINDKKRIARKEYLDNQRDRRHNIIDEFKYVSITPQDWHHIRRQEDLNHIEQKILALEEWFRNHFDNATSVTMLVDEDDADDSGDRHRRAPAVNEDQGKFGTANTRYDKDDPIRGWKQISTGFRKWAERYIAYCRAEYVEKAFSKWATEIVWRKTENIYRCRVLGQEREGCKKKKEEY